MIEYSADGKSALYCGYKFRKDGKTGYYLCSCKTDAGKRERLHNFVYRKEHNLDAIPAGYHVHHKDGNKDNNDVSNLELLTAHDHEIYHGSILTDAQRQKRRENIIANATPKARQWHGTDEGKSWHIQHGKEVYAKRQIQVYQCDNCGTEFITKNVYNNKSNKFCCKACKAAYRRKMGVDDIDRECAVCGCVFRCNKYSTVKRCKACRNRKR